MIAAVASLGSLLCLLPRVVPDPPTHDALRARQPWEMAWFYAAMPADVPSRAPSRSESPEEDPGPELIRITHREGSPWSSFRIGIRFGSALDPPGKSGLARVLGLVLARAIAEPEDDPRLLARLGGELEIETGSISTCLVGGAPKEHLDPLMRRLFAALGETRISEEAVKHAVSRALEERLRLRGDDHLLAQLELRRVLFGPHPFGRSPFGEVRDLASITSDDVRAFMKLHLSRSAIVAGIASAGDDDVGSAAREWMANLPAGPRSMNAVVPLDASSLPGRRVVLIDRPGWKQAEIVLGSILPEATRDARPALWAANAVIGGAFSSRLTEALGQSHGAAPFALSRIDPHGSADVFSIWLSLEEDKASTALQRLLEELAKLGSPGPSAGEIEFGRRAASGRAVLELRDAPHRLRAEILARLLGMPQSAPETLGTEVASLSDEDVRAAVAALASARDAVIVIVTRETPALQRALAGLPGVRDVSIVSHDDR